jgi:hypothetical protein
MTASIFYPFGIILSQESYSVYTNSDEPYFEFIMTGQHVQGGMNYGLHIVVEVVDNNWSLIFLIHVPLIPANKPDGGIAWLGNFTMANTASGSPYPPPA